MIRVLKSRDWEEGIWNRLKSMYKSQHLENILETRAQCDGRYSPWRAVSREGLVPGGPMVKGLTHPWFRVKV